MRLLILGDFSGRNIGHTVLLLGILEELSLDETEQVVVPSLLADRLSAQLPNDVEIPSLRPWTGSLKFRGRVVRKEARRADVILLVDNQLNDVGFGNPLRNNLGALVGLLRRARRQGVPVVYYNGGVGPLRHPRATRLAREIARSVEWATLRDRRTLEWFSSLAPDVPAELGADSTLNVPWGRFAVKAGQERERPPRGLAVNVSRHTLHCLAARVGTPEGALDALAHGIDRACATLELVPWFLAAHPADVPLTETLTRRLAGPGGTLLEPGSRDLVVGLARQLRDTSCAISDRYHECMLFASARLPVVGLDSGAKVEGVGAALGFESFGPLDPSRLAGDGDPLAEALQAARAAVSALSERVREGGAVSRRSADRVRTLALRRVRERGGR